MENNNGINEENTTRKIIIEESQKNKLTKKINCEKEKKMRVETKSWGLNEEELTHKRQLDFLLSDNFIKNDNNNTYISKLTSHIKNKIYN